VTALHAECEARRLGDAALKAVSQGILIVDTTYLVVWINDAFAAFTGCAAVDIVGETLMVMQGESTDPVTVDAIRAALCDGVEFSGEIQNYRRDGSLCWNDLTISPVRDRLKRLTHYAGVVRDITARHEAESERVRLQQQLQQAQKLETVGRLAGRRDALAPLRAVLHHEEQWAGNGSRAGDRLRRCAAERRLHHRVERGRRGDDVRGLSPALRRSAGGGIGRVLLVARRAW